MDTGACSQPALGCGGAEQVHDAPVGWPFGMARTDGDSSWLRLGKERFSVIMQAGKAF